VSASACGFCRKSLEGFPDVDSNPDLKRCPYCEEFWYHWRETKLDIVDGIYKNLTIDKWIPIGKRKEVLYEPRTIR
jgi:hypothetical protein